MKSILIVEDEKSITVLLKNYLCNQYQIAIAFNGKDALTLLKIQDFDYIILDIGLPEISGIDIVKFIREKQNKNTPIIVITGFNKEDIKKELEQYNIKKIFNKPFDLKKILRTIKGEIDA